MADCLSRSFDVSTSVTPKLLWLQLATDLEDEDDAVVNTIFGNLASLVVTIEAVATATSADSLLQSVIALVEQGWPPSKADVKSSCRSFYKLRKDLSVISCCLLRGCRVVIPSSLRSRMLELAHEGHPGVARMKGKCRENHLVARSWCGHWTLRQGLQCVRNFQQISGTFAGTSTTSENTVRSVEEAFARHSFIFVQAPRGRRFMLVSMDYFTKWPESATCESVTTATVIDCFERSIRPLRSRIQEISTDNGPQFTSSEFSSYMQGLGISHCLSAYYFSQSNAEVKRFNWAMKEGLRTGLADGRPFVTAVRQTLAEYIQVYRTTPHASTAVTAGIVIPSVSGPHTSIHVATGCNVITAASAVEFVVLVAASDRRVQSGQRSVLRRVECLKTTIDFIEPSCRSSSHVIL